jgi:RimJ/RimL family protein N-acetyltransferase
VKSKDIKQIFEWRNEPGVRENSFTSHKISWEEHQDYWKKRLERDSFYTFIVVADKNEVGLLRLDPAEKDKEYEVHILISSVYIGQGFGQEAISAAIKFAKKTGIKELIAKVKPDNIPSKKIFEKNGFEESRGLYRFHLTKDD